MCTSEQKHGIFSIGVVTLVFAAGCTTVVHDPCVCGKKNEVCDDSSSGIENSSSSQTGSSSSTRELPPTPNPNNCLFFGADKRIAVEATVYFKNANCNSEDCFIIDAKGPVYTYVSPFDGPQVCVAAFNKCDDDNGSWSRCFKSPTGTTEPEPCVDFEEDIAKVVYTREYCD